MTYIMLLLLVAVIFLGQEQSTAAAQPYCLTSVNETTKRVDDLMSGVLLLNKQAYECDKRLDRLEVNLMVLRHQVSNMKKESCQVENDGKINQLQNQVDELQNQVEKLQELLQSNFSARETIVEGLETTLIINRTTQFTVQNVHGHLSSGGHNVTVTLTSLDFSRCFSTEPKVTDNDNGSYLVSLTPECSGNNQITVKIDGKVIKGMPVTVAVIPSYASLKLKRNITGVLYRASGITTARNGDIFITGTSNHSIYQFNKNGELLSNWSVPGSGAYAVLVHEKNLYVSQCNSNTPTNKIWKYALNQTLVDSISGNGCYSGFEVGPDGRLYGTNIYTAKVSIFNMNNLSLFNEFSITNASLSLAFDPEGNIHVRAGIYPLIRVFSPSGLFIRKYTQPVIAGGYGTFIDKAGNLLSGNYNQIIITDKDNNLLKKITNTAIIIGITIASNGDVWVTLSSDDIFIYSQ